MQSKYNESHAIRMKKHGDGEVCNGGGDHCTGWADVGEPHLFYCDFALILSCDASSINCINKPVRRGKEEDTPLLIWLQGGPGASSMLGLLVLHGPCLVDDSRDSTTFNPHAWSEEFNVLYLDQLARIGFSYIHDYQIEDAYPRRTEESAQEFIGRSSLRLSIW